jgi:hypothetical protein
MGRVFVFYMPLTAVLEGTVSRYLPDRTRARSQTWCSFLANNLGDLTFRLPTVSPYAPGADDARGLTFRQIWLSRDGLYASNQCGRRLACFAPTNVTWPAYRPRSPSRPHRDPKQQPRSRSSRSSTTAFHIHALQRSPMNHLNRSSLLDRAFPWVIDRSARSFPQILPDRLAIVPGHIADPLHRHPLSF